MPLLHLTMSFHSRVLWRDYVPDDIDEDRIHDNPDNFLHPGFQEWYERSRQDPETQSCIVDNMLELVIILLSYHIKP